MPSSPFLFVTCQPGFEKFVKADVARRHPELRLAFSRPGFVTFKHPERPFSTEDDAPTPFARCWGPAFGGAVTTVPEAVTRLADVAAGEKALVHAFARDPFPVGEEPEGYDAWKEDALVAAEVGEPWRVNEEPRPGELVLDVISVDERTFWTGAHRHTSTRRATPGGRPPKRVLPVDAPSRVWLKIEEAIWWTGAAPGPGDTVLDVGCAPGGGSFALLQRGARVIGVDPGEVASVVKAHPLFEHRAIPFERVTPEMLPREVGWLVFDVNLSPLLTLGALKRLGQGLKRVRTAFITLKLNKLEHVDKIDWMLKQIRDGGFRDLRVTQLFHNRQEMFVYARR